MQNTDCCPCSEFEIRTRTIELFGKNVVCKDYLCSENGGPYLPKPEKLKLQLSICPTYFCPGSCPFCIAYPKTATRETMDFGWLETVLYGLRAQEIVRGVSITGGEPFCDMERLNRLVNLLFQVFGRYLEVSLNTNGMAIQRIHELDMLSHIDAIHISRHHYDSRINNSIFGLQMPDNDVLRETLHSVCYPDIFVLNCMLMKDYIGTPQEAHRFLDFAIDMGAGKVSFITGTPINGFVRQQAVKFDSVIRPDDPQLLFTQHFQDYELCRCQDGVYVSPQGALMEFYGRETNPGGCSYARGLVCDPDNHLRAGFGGELIL